MLQRVLSRYKRVVKHLCWTERWYGTFADFNKPKEQQQQMLLLFILKSLKYVAVQRTSFVLFFLFLFFYIEINKYFYDRYSKLEFAEKRYHLPIFTFLFVLITHLFLLSTQFACQTVSRVVKLIHSCIKSNFDVVRFVFNPGIFDAHL